MSVTTYDSSFSFKQDQVARLGDRAKDRVQMTAQDRVKFEQSPFMQKMKEEQICAVAARTRSDRQTLLLSRTWSEAAQDLADGICVPGGKLVSVTHGRSTSARGGRTRAVASGGVVHEVVVFDDGSWEERDAKKRALLFDYVREALEQDDHKVLAMVSGKKLADALCQSFFEEGFRTESIHSGRGQERRLEALAQFDRGELQLLAATDTSFFMGSEVKGASHVIIYDMDDMDGYLRHVGRAAPGPYGPGRTLLFYEYDRKWPDLPGRLIEALEQRGQEVPEELRRIAYEVANGLREARWGAHGA